MRLKYACDGVGSVEFALYPSKCIPYNYRLKECWISTDASFDFGFGGALFESHACHFFSHGNRKKEEGTQALCELSATLYLKWSIEQTDALTLEYYSTGCFTLSRSFIPFVQVARHNFFCDFLPVLRRNI